MTALDVFLRACADEIGRRAPLAETRRSIFEAGHAAFTSALDHADRSRPPTHEPSTVPVAAALHDASGGPLVDLARAAADELSWVPSSRLDDDGTEAALAPLNDLRDLGAVVAGLMLLAPAGVYPLHSHPPQELYLPIAGDGEWRFGGSEHFRRLADDELVYNHPNDVHSVVAGDEPLLALYVLWGADTDALP